MSKQIYKKPLEGTQKNFSITKKMVKITKMILQTIGLVKVCM